MAKALTKEQMDCIKSSAPVLAEYGTTITKCFYSNLFNAHPELLNLFNHSNQKQTKQQQALANTLYAAAANIEQLESLLPVHSSDCPKASESSSEARALSYCWSALA